MYFVKTFLLMETAASVASILKAFSSILLSVLFFGYLQEHFHFAFELLQVVSNSVLQIGQGNSFYFYEDGH